MQKFEWGKSGWGNNTRNLTVLPLTTTLLSTPYLVAWETNNNSSQPLLTADKHKKTHTHKSFAKLGTNCLTLDRNDVLS